MPPCQLIIVAGTVVGTGLAGMHEPVCLILIQISFAYIFSCGVVILAENTAVT